MNFPHIPFRENSMISSLRGKLNEDKGERNSALIQTSKREKFSKRKYFATQLAHNSPFIPF